MIALRKRFGRLLRERGGTAAVEFAFVSIPLVLLAVGTVDFGRTLFAQNSLSHAADVGARLILLDNAVADADVEAAITDDFTGGPGDGLAVTLGTASQSGTNFRTIRLTYDVDLLTPFVIPGEIVLSHDRRVPLE